MTNQVLSELILQIILYVILSIFVFATIEVIKGVYKSITKGKKIHKNILRYANFVIAYGYAWTFNFQFANNVMKLANPSNRSLLNQHINYLIVASLIYVGAKKIWISYYKKNKEIINDVVNAKKLLLG